MKRTNYLKGMSIALILTLALGCGSLAAFASGEAAAPGRAAAGTAETEAAGAHGKGASGEIEAAVPEEDAVAAALKDAGFEEEDVTVHRTRLREREDEDGNTIPVYTVRFHTEDTTYKYHVDADTGRILDSSATEGVSEHRSRGEASGEMSGAASGEMKKDADSGTAADGEVDAATSATEKGGKSRRAASGETGDADMLTDAAAV